MKFSVRVLLTAWTILISTLVFAQTSPININTADIVTLTQLERIGPKYAERIVKYRETNGPFEKIEDIQKIAGIGAKTYEANKDRMVVSESDPKSTEAESQ